MLGQLRPQPRNCPPSELEHVRQSLRDDLTHDIQIKRLIVVDGDIAKANHAHQAFCEWTVEARVGREQFECLAAVLGNTEVSEANEMHREVDAGFAGALQVEHDRVLLGLVALEDGVVTGVFSRTRRTQRSIAAALFKITSSIDAT